MSSSVAFRIVETHRGTGVHAFQGPERIEVVKRAIDHVLALRDLKELAEYAYDIAKPPEARLLATNFFWKACSRWRLRAARSSRLATLIWKRCGSQLSALESLHWIDLNFYGTILAHAARPWRRFCAKFGAISRCPADE